MLPGDRRGRCLLDKGHLSRGSGGAAGGSFCSLLEDYFGLLTTDDKLMTTITNQSMKPLED